MGLFIGQVIRPLDWGWSIQRNPIPCFLGVGLGMLPGYWWGVCNAIEVYHERMGGAIVYGLGDWDKAPKPLRDGLWEYDMPNVQERKRRCKAEERQREEDMWNKKE